MLRRLFDFLPLLGALLLAIVCGYLLGRLVTVRLEIPATPITVRDLQRPLVPTVRIDGIRNGSMEGGILGGARLFIGGHQVPADASGSFRVPASSVLTNLVTVSVPEGMPFVASRRGKKYYPVGSSQAAALSLENRVYFRTAEEAEGAGYRR